MNVLQIAKLIGREATLKIESLSVRVIVRDAKTAYGSLRFDVEPIAGSGRQTVDQSRLTF